MPNAKWSGLFPATAMPFKENFDIDEAEFRKLLSWLIGVRGVTGVVVNSHAGEISHTTPDERKVISDIAVKHVNGASLVVSGILAEGNREAAQMARDAKNSGIDGLLVMPPHRWLRKGKSLEEALNFFEAIAEASNLPIIIHQYPAVTKASYDAEALVALAKKIAQVVAVKFGTREFARYERQVYELRKHAPQVSVLTCHDEYLLASTMAGIDGAILGFATFVPELISDMMAAAQRDDWGTARKLNEQLFLLKQATYGLDEPPLNTHALLKEGMVMRGHLKHARARPPIPPVTPAERQRLQSVMEKIGMLPVAGQRAA